MGKVVSMERGPMHASTGRPRWHLYRQRRYVLFGVEVDRDVDATDVGVHFWPLSVDLTLPPRRREGN